MHCMYVMKQCFKSDCPLQYPDLTKPLDKRAYRSPTIPVCHDFNLMTRSTEKLDLVLGFSTGPVQYVNPIGRHSVCAFNDDVSQPAFSHIYTS